MPPMTDRETLTDAANPLGLDGIEFIEYATSKPQALGQVLEMMGFRPVARHRSREVLLYRQGGMNVVINAHVSHHPRALQPTETPVIDLMEALRASVAASKKSDSAGSKKPAAKRSGSRKRAATG